MSEWRQGPTFVWNEAAHEFAPAEPLGLFDLQDDSTIADHTYDPLEPAIPR
jgi:hypothetical protein